MLDARFSKKLGDYTLDINLTAEAETLGLLGQSGCGKSMTLKCIAGLEKPDTGRIVLDGRVLFDSDRQINLSPQARRVGYLFQQPSLFPNMTVAQNIAAGVRTTDKAVRQSIVRNKIEAMHLNGLEDCRPARLSGGQLQRVAIARVLASQPDLLLLDEPLSALDDHLRWHLELELSDTLKGFARTAVFVSHSRDEIYRLCDSVSVLHDGVSQPKRQVCDLFRRPDTLAASRLSGCKNHSRVKKSGERRVEALDWGVSLVYHNAKDMLPDWIGVRAHQIRLSDGQSDNCFECEVERVIDNLFSTIVMLRPLADVSGQARLRMEMESEQWATLGQPAQIKVHIPEQDILLLKESYKEDHPDETRH